MSGERPRSTAGWWIGGGIVAVVALTAVIALAVNSGDDAKVADGVEQTRSVEVVGTALALLPDTGPDPAIGQIAPTLSGQSFDGAPVSVNAGSPTLLVFLAHWCAHCQREVPLLVQWNADGGVPAGVQVFGVSTATSNERPNYPPSVWLADAGFPWPVLADTASQDAANAMGLSGFPYFVLLDAEGRVRMRASGEIDPAILASQITDALDA